MKMNNDNKNNRLNYFHLLFYLKHNSKHRLTRRELLPSQQTPWHTLMQTVRNNKAGDDMVYTLGTMWHERGTKWQGDELDGDDLVGDDLTWG